MIGRPCTVCAHRDRKDIEIASARGETPSAVSLRFAPLSQHAIRRHMSDHAPRTMALAAEAVGSRDLAAGLGLNEEARELYLEARSILGEARATKKLPTALDAIGRALNCLDLLGKLTGRLKPDTQVNVLVMPEWISLRDRIADALEPYPDAREAVRRAIGGD